MWELTLPSVYVRQALPPSLSLTCLVFNQRCWTPTTSFQVTSFNTSPFDLIKVRLLGPLTLVRLPPQVGLHIFLCTGVS